MFPETNVWSTSSTCWSTPLTLENFHRVFKEIRGADCASAQRSDFLRQEVQVLGHVVREEGVATDPAKVEAVRNWPVPRHVGEDASDVGIGAVLSQEGEGGERAVAYYSWALSRPERNYYVTRRELPAVVSALHHV